MYPLWWLIYVFNSVVNTKLPCRSKVTFKGNTNSNMDKVILKTIKKPKLTENKCFRKEQKFVYLFSDEVPLRKS